MDRHIRYDGISDSVDDKGYKGVVDMSRDKQIEEMAKILVNGCTMGGCEECECSEGDYPECALKYTANKLYNAGYRKASEVVLEVIDDISNFLESRNGVGHIVVGIVELKHRLYELKKKYIGEDINIPTKESEKDNG